MINEAFSVQKIGIAMTVYRPQLDVFFEQLQSIQRQSFQNWVCVVAADSSLDEIFADPRFAVFDSRRGGDPRWLWVENSIRLGHKKNFEKAIQRVLEQGVDAIACADHDDIWYPDKLLVCAEALVKAGPYSLVHCDMHPLYDGKIQEKSTWEMERRGVQNVRTRHLMVRNVVAGCAMLFDARLAGSYPLIPEGFEYHDHWYAVVASCLGGVHPIARPLYAYRQHQNNELGITPFRRIFSLGKITRASDFFSKCRKGWKKTQSLVSATQASGLPLKKRELFVFSAPLTSLRLLCFGMRHHFDDPALARACYARSIGAFVD